MDVTNAIKIVRRRVDKLRPRILKATDLNDQIHNAGIELSGNCSNKDEEDCIRQIGVEAPEMQEGLKSDLAEIDQILKQIKGIEKSK